LRQPNPIPRSGGGAPPAQNNGRRCQRFLSAFVPKGKPGCVQGLPASSAHGPNRPNDTFLDGFRGDAEIFREDGDQPTRPMNPQVAEPGLGFSTLPSCWPRIPGETMRPRRWPSKLFLSRSWCQGWGSPEKRSRRHEPAKAWAASGRLLRAGQAQTHRTCGPILATSSVTVSACAPGAGQRFRPEEEVVVLDTQESALQSREAQLDRTSGSGAPPARRPERRSFGREP